LSPRTARTTLDRLRYLEQNHLLSEQAFVSFLVSLKGKKSASTLNKWLQAVRHYCRYYELTWKLPPQQTEHNKKRDTFSDEEIEKILGIAKTPYKEYLSILAFTGARPGEVLAIQPEDIDKASWSVNIHGTKTFEDRQIPIHERIKPIFDHFKPFPFSDSAVRKELALICQRLQIPYRPPYSFRHSLITRLVNSDVPLFNVMAIAGHKSTDTTLHYFRHNLQSLTKAIERDTLGIRSMTQEQKLDLLKRHLRELLDRLHLDEFEVELKENDKGVSLQVKKRSK
jgi:integrase